MLLNEMREMAVGLDLIQERNCLLEETIKMYFRNRIINRLALTKVFYSTK